VGDEAGAPVTFSISAARVASAAPASSLFQAARRYPRGADG
jgi:hypothetical protein